MMNLPFTFDQFLEVFVQYNNAVWPAQIALNLLALVAISVTFARSIWTDKVVGFVLSVLWIWCGWAYHITFFAPINPAAMVFGALFVLQGLLFLVTTWKGSPTFRATRGWRQAIGAILVVYALVLYPILGYLLGHVFPAAPSFGAPCPTTIFTFGVLLWSDRSPLYLLIIPALWSLIGFTAAVNFGMLEDIGLLASSVTAVGLILWSRRTVRSAVAMVIVALLIPSGMSAQEKETGPEQRYKHSIDLSPMSPLFRIYAVHYCYRITPNSEVIVAPYYANIKFPDIGHTDAPGFIVGYRYYLWGMLHVDYQLMPQWDRFYEQNENKKYPVGFDLWNEFRLGYTWDFEVSSVPAFVNVQWPFGFALYSDGSAKPESFKKRARENPYFYCARC